MTLTELFEIAADAYEEGRDVGPILAQAGDAACWYWVIGPERGRPRTQTAIPRWTYPRTLSAGYKGRSFLETGFVYAPYVPIVITPVEVDLSDYVTGSLMSRYANHIVDTTFYGHVSIIEDE